MRQASFQDGELTYTGATATEHGHRWEIAFDLASKAVTIANLTLTVTADTATAADLLGERCIAHYRETGRVPNLPEQKDPLLLAVPSAVQCIKALRFLTGQDLSRCYQAYTRRNEPAFGGDAVLALTTLMVEAVPAENPDFDPAAWARTYAEKFRREEPKLNETFPLAA